MQGQVFLPVFAVHVLHPPICVLSASVGTLAMTISQSSRVRLRRGCVCDAIVPSCSLHSVLFR